MRRRDLAIGAFTLLIVGWFLSTLEWREVGVALARVRPGWLAVAGLAGLADYTLRAVRWTVLLRYFDPRLPPLEAVRATMIGNALNTVLPLRMGDVARPMLLAARCRIPLATAMSTTVVERVFDAVGLVICLAVLYVAVKDASGTTPAMIRVREWTGPAVLTAVGAIAALVVAASRSARWVAKAAVAPLERGLRGRVWRTYRHVAVGLDPLWSPWQLFGGLITTMLLWSATTSCVVAGLLALDVAVPPSGALFTAVALSVAISVPQAPGYLGTFQVVAAESLVLFGAGRGDAQAAAIVIWAAYMLPVTAVGGLTWLWDRRP